MQRSARGGVRKCAIGGREGLSFASSYLADSLARHASPRLALLPRTARPLQQNEVMRENQFYTWQIGKKNIVGLVMFAVVIPLGMRQIVMSEMQLRDETAGRPQRERV